MKLGNITLQYGISNDEYYKWSGPNNTNFKLCYNFNINQAFNHLYKGQCLNECPEGTYKYIYNYYFICKDCYKNCKSCSQSEDYTNMHCDSCINENYIKKGNNFYHIYDNNNKTFYNPGKNMLFSIISILYKRLYI